LLIRHTRARFRCSGGDSKVCECVGNVSKGRDFCKGKCGSRLDGGRDGAVVKIKTVHDQQASVATGTPSSTELGGCKFMTSTAHSSKWAVPTCTPLSETEINHIIHQHISACRDSAISLARESCSKFLPCQLGRAQ
jgi:hypothetical protein